MLITKLDVGHIISSPRMRLGYDGGVWIPPPWKVAVQGVTNIAKSGLINTYDLIIFKGCELLPKLLNQPPHIFRRASTLFSMQNASQYADAR